ncbi:MAG: DUF3109 family protein [Chitinophagales bacterium]|nr:DUF3109 family protein [Chitinophagales bacterium]
MLVVDNLLVSEEVFEKQFVCNLSKCKGACCVAGDSGAPLTKEEVKTLELEYENYKDYITEEGKASIAKNGFTEFDPEDKKNKTVLIKSGPCAYINYEKNGTAICGIEKAYLEGKTKFRKPISCHLYPIRVSSIGELTAANYEEWDICSDACTLGQELKMPVYKFLKDPLIRAYGEDTYATLDSYYQQNYNQK